MGTYVTAVGLAKKTLAEVKGELEISFKGVFGESIDLGPEGPFGQLIGLLSKREANLWDALQEIYTARDPSAATGVSLDNISAETGVKRIDAGKSTAPGVLIYGLDATPVTTAFQIRQQNGPVDFALDAAITISLLATRHVELEPDAPTVGKIYRVTIDSIDYSYTALAGDTETDVVDALVTAIQGGSWGGTAANVNDDLSLKQFSSDFALSHTATLTLELLGSAGNFTALVAGPYPVPANTLIEIVTPLAGVDSVNNPSVGLTGRNQEEDKDMRLRRDQSTFAGKGTEETIRSALLNRVENIQQASVISNRSMITDSEGRPPKSFEAVINGGAEQDIADVIWDTMPAGIEPYGTIHRVAVDSEGQNQDIYFSRPGARYIHIQVKRALYAEEQYPADGDQAIKSSIVAWALKNQFPGVDVIRQRLSVPVYEVSGVGKIEIRIDVTTNPTDPPTWGTDDIPIADREYADFAEDRISVLDLP